MQDTKTQSMHSIIVISLLIIMKAQAKKLAPRHKSDTQDSIGNLADKLAHKMFDTALDRRLKDALALHADLESTTLRKQNPLEPLRRRVAMIRNPEAFPLQEWRTQFRGYISGNVGIVLSTWSLVNTWPSFDADHLAILKTSLDVVAVVVCLLDTVVLMWLQRAISRSAPTGKLCRIVNVNTLTCTFTSTLALTTVLVSLIRYQLRSRYAMFSLTYLLVTLTCCLCFRALPFLLLNTTLSITIYVAGFMMPLNVMISVSDSVLYVFSHPVPLLRIAFLFATVLLPVPKVLVIHAFKRYVLAQAAQRSSGWQSMA